MGLWSKPLSTEAPDRISHRHNAPPFTPILLNFLANNPIWIAHPSGTHTKFLTPSDTIIIIFEQMLKYAILLIWPNARIRS